MRKFSNFFAIPRAVLAACLGGCAAMAPTPLPLTVAPEALRPPPTAALALRTQASGVQIYGCTASADDAARFEWTLTAPEADLFDEAGKRIGRHYAGPTWEALDGSKVVGEVQARAGAPDPGAIAWLLLAVRSNSGIGVLGQVQWVQRLDTVGGKAPAGGCDAAHAGAEVRVPYKASYYFYSARP